MTGSAKGLICKSKTKPLKLGSLVTKSVSKPKVSFTAQARLERRHAPSPPLHSQEIPCAAGLPIGAKQQPSNTMSLSLSILLQRKVSGLCRRRPAQTATGISGQKRGVTPRIKRELRRRAAV